MPATSPSIHSDHVMVYELSRSVTVLFGGSVAVGAVIGDTWTWDGTTWSQRSPANSPPARERHAMAHDAGRGRTVVFGGRDASGINFNDTWEWDGSDWTQVVPANSPPARHDHAMAYDWATSRVLMFGGRDAFGTLGDTWAWDGTDWTQLMPATVPPARRDFTLATDFHRQRIVMFGGFPGASIFTTLNDTWEWNGSDWVARSPSTFPSGRGGYAIDYDWFRRRTVLFSGFGGGNLQDTWEWDGNGWRLRQPMGSPSGRSGHAMAYDVARQNTVMFAGYDFAFLADTWLYATTAVPTVASYGSGCAGSAGVPSLGPAPDSLPWLDNTFVVAGGSLPPSPLAFLAIGLSRTTWNALPLPFSLAGLGMPGCSLFTSVDLALATVPAAGSASWSIPICDCQGAIGLAFFLQALVLDPAAGNSAMAIVTNALEARIGAR